MGDKLWNSFKEDRFHFIIKNGGFPNTLDLLNHVYPGNLITGRVYQVVTSTHDNNDDNDDDEKRNDPFYLRSTFNVQKRRIDKSNIGERVSCKKEEPVFVPDFSGDTDVNRKRHVVHEEKL